MTFIVIVNPYFRAGFSGVFSSSNSSEYIKLENQRSIWWTLMS